MSYQFDKLNFFWAATGSFGKLQKMQQVAAAQDDPALSFNTSLLTGNVQERVKTLAKSGQLPLAYMAAKTHGLHEMAEKIEEELGNDPQFDHIAILDEVNKYEGRGQSLVPLRPLSLQDQEAHFVQWPMSNLRAKEAAKAEEMFQREKELKTPAATNEDIFGTGSSFQQEETKAEPEAKQPVV